MLRGGLRLDHPTPVSAEGIGHVPWLRGNAFLGLHGQTHVTGRRNGELQPSQNTLFAMVVRICRKVRFGMLEFSDPRRNVLFG